jgi:hypothetical protein
MKIAASPVLVSDKPLTSSNAIIGKRKPLHFILELALNIKTQLT